VNDWLGRVIGVLTLTPYDFWRRAHGIHHATSGNLDRRGIGDIDTLTVREYVALSRWRRVAYRLYRHPIIMFGVGPIYLFLLRHRVPFGLAREGWTPWVSTMATNGAAALLAAGMMWWVGVVPSCSFICRSPSWQAQSGRGYSTSSTNSSTRSGLKAGIGASRRRRSTAVRTTTLL
jgi:fatty acid desaturase